MDLTKLKNWPYIKSPHFPDAVGGGRCNETQQKPSKFQSALECSGAKERMETPRVIQNIQCVLRGTQEHSGAIRSISGVLLRYILIRQILP